MASVTLDPQSNTYHVRFRYAGRAFKRSLDTTDRKAAIAAKGRIEETLMLLKNGRLNMPQDADPGVFILSDGKRESKHALRILTLGEICSMYQERRIDGVKEPSTVATEDLHIRHLLRLLGKKTIAQSLSVSKAQQYAARRLREKRRKTIISPETVRKEIATLRVVWNWGVKQGLLDGAAPVSGISYPKRDEKPPFMTYKEIQATIARGGLVGKEINALWECLFLTIEEIHELLDHVQKHSRHPFIYPMLVFFAHTGTRLSEVLRSRVDDIDLAQNTVLIREKKRSRTRATTYRRIELSPRLHEALSDWLAIHPGGPHTFCKAPDLRGTPNGEPVVPLHKHIAREHLLFTLERTKWHVLRGFHIFRHSFASNLAARGVDQRIIDEWMGHQTEEMRRRYRHLLPDTKQAAILRLLPS